METAGLLALLVLSLGTEFKVAGLGVGLPNLAATAAAVGLLVAERRRVVEVTRRHPRVCAALAATAAWTLLAGALSPAPVIALRIAAKVFLYCVLGFALLLWMDGGTRAGSAQRAVLAFLALLAVGGLLEAVAPGHPLFRLLRTPDSLAIQPRVSSFLTWPNVFGCLMVAGLALAVGARASAAPAASRGLLALQLLFVVQIAQSGSRNAWIALGLTLPLLLFRGALRARAGVALAAAFVVLLVALPVPTYQLGLKASRAFPLAPELLPQGARDSTSFASASQTFGMRMQLWQLGLREITLHPVQGLGPGVFTTSISPFFMKRSGLNAHNVALTVAVDTGLVGLALAAGLGVAIARDGGPLAPCVDGALFAMLAAQLADCFLYEPAFATVGLVLLAARVARGPS